MVSEFQAGQCRYNVDVIFGSVSLVVFLNGKWRTVALGKVTEDGGWLVTRTYHDRLTPHLERLTGQHIREMVRKQAAQKAKMYREIFLGDLARQIEQKWSLPPQLPDHYYADPL